MGTRVVKSRTSTPFLYLYLLTSTTCAQHNTTVTTPTTSYDEVFEVKYEAKKHFTPSPTSLYNVLTHHIIPLDCASARGRALGAVFRRSTKGGM